jgi:hypothetical protein
MRTPVRVVAVLTLALLIAYHLMRVAATACSGSACDAYIPVSLLLPLLVLAGAAASGVLAILAARRDRPWLIVVNVCTAAGVIGPIVALVVLRDSPDAFVVTSTILVALPPVSALAYTFTRYTR